MPKYRKKRFNYPSYPVAFPAMPMGMPMPMYPFAASPIPPMSAPIPAFPLPLVKSEASDHKSVSPKSSGSRSESNAPKDEEPSVASQNERHERACLPFFQDEITETAPREPTDIIIVDFDRTLLASPLINRDLFDRASRHTLEFKLGPGKVWGQCRPVLESAIAEGRWNFDLVEIAKEAASNDGVVLVITTARAAAEIGLIKQALADVGVDKVDHFACSTPAVDEDDDHAEPAMLGGWAKQAMIELLLESYDFLERVFVFDNDKSDRQKYSRAVSQFVRDGWLNAEAFHLVDLPQLAPSPSSLVSQRELVDQVLAQANVPVTTSVVVLEWLHKLTLESQRELATLVTERLGDRVDRILCEDISISKGSLPPDLRGLAQRGAQWKWQVSGYKVESRLLWLRVQAVSGAGLQYSVHTNLKAARLVREFNEDAAAAELASFAQSPPIETFIYERRELRIQRIKHV